MKTILILTCGANACYHVARVLREKFKDQFMIIGTDIHDRHLVATSVYLDKFYRSPLSKSPEYYDFVLNICKKDNVDYLLPLFDTDQLLFCDGNRDLQDVSVKSFGIPQSAVDKYCDKAAMYAFLNNHHLPIPQYYKPEDVNDSQEYFIKPIDGNGSRGIELIKGRELKKRDCKDILIQEVCHEPEVTIECFLFNGKVYSVARERIDTKAGVCTKAKVYHAPQLEAIAQRFSEVLELPNMFNLQFMLNANGEPVITDVNLRIAGGMSLSYAAGWDVVTALGRMMLGNGDVVSTVNVKTPEQYVIRAYTDLVTKRINKRICFDLDGTLLDSRKRHKTVMEYVLREFNITLQTDDLLVYKSDGHNNISWLLSKGFSESNAIAINNRWVELIEEEKFLIEDTLYDNSISILSSLSNENSLTLLTARNNKTNAEKEINRLGIRHFFDNVIVVETSRKTPELKGCVLKQLEIDEFYGDTESDMKAAELSGCKFFASTRGFRSSNFWKNFKVDVSSMLDEN